MHTYTWKTTVYVCNTQARIMLKSLARIIYIITSNLVAVSIASVL